MTDEGIYVFSVGGVEFEKVSIGNLSSGIGVVKLWQSMLGSEDGEAKRHEVRWVVWRQSPAARSPSNAIV